MVVWRSQWLCPLLLGGWLWVGSPAMVLSMPESPVQVLQTQQKRWREREMTDYQFTLQIRVFAPLPANQPLRVTVRHEKVTRIVNLADGQDLPLDVQPRVLTIDQLFSTINRALQDDVEKLGVTYHSDMGYPTTIDINPQLILADDEITYFVSDLQPI